MVDRLKSTVALFVALALCGSASAQPFFVRQSTTYDARTFPPEAERFITDNSVVAAQQTTNLQAILDRIHLTTNNLRQDVVLSGGNYYFNGNVHIGCDAAETTARAGGCFVGSGGFAPGLSLQAVASRMGNITRINDVSVDRTGASMVYGGAHYTIGNFSLYGFPFIDAGDATDRNTADKKEVGLRIMGMPTTVSGLETGSFLHALPMEFMGYETAIKIQPHSSFDDDIPPFSRQSNDTFWQFLYFDTCDTCIHLNDAQSVTHHFYYIQPDIYTTRVFYIQRGGNVFSYGGTIRYPNQTLLEIGDDEWDYAHGNIELRNWKLDDLATEGTILIKLGSPNGNVPRNITLTGSVGTNVGFDDDEVGEDGPVQGGLPGDKVFFNFVGNPTQAAMLNDFSTVDASGNWREKYLDFNDPGTIATGDGQDYVSVPADMNGWRLHAVIGSVQAASSSGVPAWQLRRVRAATPADMLTTKFTIDANELDATASVAAVPDGSNDDVATGDQIYLDNDVAGTSTSNAKIRAVFRRY